MMQLALPAGPPVEHNSHYDPDLYKTQNLSNLVGHR